MIERKQCPAFVGHVKWVLGAGYTFQGLWVWAANTWLGDTQEGSPGRGTRRCIVHGHCLIRLHDEHRS
jgi:hypothetical protein